VRKLVVRPPGPEGRFQKQWRWIPERRRLENALHGAAVQVFDAVDEVTGKVEYEGIAIESRRIELHVVVRQDDHHVGLVSHRRLSVIPPNVSAAEFAKNPERILSVLEYGSGMDEYEASHGLAVTPLEEVGQEIGLKVIVAESIGFIKESPPLGGVAHELFAVVVGRESSGETPEPNEEIHCVKFFPPEKVKNIETICGVTQAALWRFRSWGLAQARGTIWSEVASRL